MGCGSSTVKAAPPTDRSLQFDRMLQEEKLKDQLHFKLLCLGAGESGESNRVQDTDM